MVTHYCKKRKLINCNHSCNLNAHILMIKIDTDEPKIIKNKSSTKKNARERDAIAMNIRTLSQEICPWMSKHYALRSCWLTFFSFFTSILYIMFCDSSFYILHFCQSFAGSFCVPTTDYDINHILVNLQRDGEWRIPMQKVKIQRDGERVAYTIKCEDTEYRLNIIYKMWQETCCTI